MYKWAVCLYVTHHGSVTAIGGVALVSHQPDHPFPYTDLGVNTTTLLLYLDSN